MEYFAITGGRPLEGSVPIQGAKNSALPILAATLLARGESVVHNCPDLTDITTALEILTALGCRVRREGRTVTVDTTGRIGTAVPDGLMVRMRASVLFLGSLLAAGGEASARWPGGCALGDRPIDLHIRAFQALGTQVRDREGTLFCQAKALRGCRLALPFPSVGATENAMLAACGAAGVTVIDNAAREPEIRDLQDFLQTLGAEVQGAGTDRIVIRGGRPLHPGTYTVMADRIVTATCLCAVAATGGEADLRGGDGAVLGPVLTALRRGGCQIEQELEGLWIRQTGKLRGIGRIVTQPYPGFPTDAQPLLAAALATGLGESTIEETIFDQRFRYGAGLRAMGAGFQVEQTTARITGTDLHGAEVTAADLRGGAALTIAALAAEGESTVHAPDHVDRGYERLEETFQALGGDIRRVTREGK